MEAAMCEDAPVVDVDPFSDDNLDNPLEMHARIREAGPVVRIPAYDLIGVARHAEIQAVLGDWNTYISSAGVGLVNFNHEPPLRPRSLLLETDPPDPTRARKIVSRIHSPSSLQQLGVVFQREAESLVDRLLQQTQIDGVGDLAQAFPLKVFPDAVGLADEGRAKLLLYGELLFNGNGPRNERFRRSLERAEGAAEWIMGRCRREALRPGGFGDQIYQAADAGEITFDEAPMLVRSFLSAGVDTTVSALGNALLCLATFPDQYARLHANPSLARSAFEESLRYDSAVQLAFRTTARETELVGVRIPADRKVVAFLAAANRDPRKWADPDRFDISRRQPGLATFGFGIHGCVGQVVARMEGEALLGALARRVERIELAGAPQRRLNNSMRALAALPLRLVPR
jgi:cytochrome P450